MYYMVGMTWLLDWENVRELCSFLDVLLYNCVDGLLYSLYRVEKMCCESVNVL